MFHEGKVNALPYDEIQKDNNSYNIESRGGHLACKYEFSEPLSATAGYFFEIDDLSKVAVKFKLLRAGHANRMSGVLQFGGEAQQNFIDIFFEIKCPLFRVAPIDCHLFETPNPLSGTM
ncbi:MAG: hypothetical protein GY801_13735 [bacterium]|nr:hypothetical protein [bacterium]